MKNKILIETAEEFIEFSNPTRVVGDKKPFLNPAIVYLEVTSYEGLVLWDAEEKFMLASDITYKNLVKAMAKALQLNIKFEDKNLLK